MQSENTIGIVAGICTAASLLPQLIIMVKEKKATDISIWMLLTLLTGIGLWIWYGILKKDLPIVATNIFSLLVNIAIITFRWLYKNGKKQCN